jgi:hypothetical protein
MDRRLSLADQGKHKNHPPSRQCRVKALKILKYLSPTIKKSREKFERNRALTRKHAMCRHSNHCSLSLA